MPALTTLRLRATAFGAALLGIALSPAHAMNINVTYDSSLTGQANAAAIQTAFETVVGYFEAAIANPIDVNICVGWGKVCSNSMGGGNVGETRISSAGTFNYATTVANLLAGGVTATLPLTNPTGKSLIMPMAQAKALGMTGLPTPTYDAMIGFSSTLAFKQFNPLVSPLLAYDFMGVAKHEIEHALGRLSGLLGATPLIAYASDIYRYTAVGVNSYSYSAAAYASVDGGTTVLGTYNNSPSGADRVDWKAPGTTKNAQNATLETGKDYCLSTADQRLLGGLGYKFTAAAANLYVSGADCAPLGADAAAFAAFPLSLTSVPEPTTLALLAAGAVSLGVIRRRRRGGPPAQ